ncbi:hypothetical protein B0H15DRAFT_89168 [Mycena belliarum]|uniref:Uncharacterized protein n=1 Tax=Mycena belliarum TaxID=1033014 RepID=A0AAD6TPM4_9AGAR|nr:hypothetical protein B0H15DRAFT_89168 [Mycena belliae]
MPPRKPTWDFKARNCSEFDYYTEAFAVKEYVQNIVGQVQKDLQVREWSDWEREDLRELTPKQREQRKQTLISAYPGLLTGPHGAALKRLKAWAPCYILSATIPQSRLRTMFVTTDLQVAIVVWHHSTLEILALSFYNNHLDKKTRFTNFTVDGSSTSRDNPWAVGEKGKGFILATQYLTERVEQYVAELKGNDVVLPKDVKEGVSFRVGHQVGTVKWKKRRYENEDEVLQAVLDDLTPCSVEEYMEIHAADMTKRRVKRKDSSDEEDDDDLELCGFKASPDETPNLRKKAEAAMKGVYSRRVTQQLDRKSVNATDALNNHGRCLVSSDEVCVTVVGLHRGLRPEYLFSDIYGIIPPPQAWRVPGSQVEFFIAAADEIGPSTDKADARITTKFYHRDQHVPYGIHLNRVSFNYHGDLNITSDRVSIIQNRKVDVYRQAVASSADQAFRTIPTLALELALDVLSDEHANGLAHLVRPGDKAGGAAYRAAFEAALRKLHPEIPEDAHIQPTSSEDITAPSPRICGSHRSRCHSIQGPPNARITAPGLCEELGLTPISVASKAWEVMESSGAYITPEAHARQVLLAAPHAHVTHGLYRLRVALAVVAPDVPSANITVRVYDKSEPRVVWDAATSVFAFALPPECDVHARGACFCWVGPFLHDAAKEFNGAQLDTTKLFRAYLVCMKGEASLEADVDEDTIMSDDLTQGEEDPKAQRTPSVAQNDNGFVPSSNTSPTIHGCSTPRSRIPAPENERSARSRPSSPFKPGHAQASQRVRTPPSPSPSSSSSTSQSQSPSPAPAPAPGAADILEPGTRRMLLTPLRFDRFPPPGAPPAAGPSVPTKSRSEDPGVDPDAALAGVAALAASYKEKKAALAERSTIMASMQAELDQVKAARDALGVQLEMLRIDCATYAQRVAELERAGEAKDAAIAALQAEVEGLTAVDAAVDAAAEAFVQAQEARKRRRLCH